MNFHFEVESYMEDDMYPKLRAHIFNKFYQLPLLVKPYEFPYTYRATWEEGKPLKTRTAYANRRWGMYLFENHFVVMWGFQQDGDYEFEQSGKKNQSWSCFLPWTEINLVSDKIRSFKTYRLYDYDGEEIEAYVELHDYVWSWGRGWFKWLKYVRPNKKASSLEIEFNGETGSGKGTWKGGTIGTSCPFSVLKIKSTTDIDAAMKVWCKRHRMFMRG